MFTLTPIARYYHFNIIFFVRLSFFFYLQQSYIKKKLIKTKSNTFYQLNKYWFQIKTKLYGFKYTYKEIQAI